MIKLLIFDFDGTLVDTREVIYDLVERSIEKFNYSIEHKLIQDGLSNQTLKEFLPLLGIKDKDVDRIINHSNLEQINHVPHIEGTRTLKSLKRINKRKIVISNNLSEFIKSVFKSLGIDFFDEIYGEDSFEKGKPHKIKEIMRRDNLKPGEIIYIGDRERDIKVARSVGCFSAIICNKHSWGDKKEILKSKPDFIISSLSQIDEIVKKIDKLKS
jgi:phosphoglycolate phosphatase